MSDGWIPAWRQLFEPDHWLAPTKINPAGRREAWLDLCQMATHKPRDVRGERLEQGEIIVSVRTLADRWAWSKSRVSRFMDELESRTAIGTVRGTPLGTVYRIVKYGTYAIAPTGQRDTMRDAERDRSGTPVGQEQPLTTNQTAYTSDFETLWEVHRKGPKRKAFDEYRKAVKSGTDHETIMRALTAYTRTFRGDFQGAHLFRWLRDERWLDVRPMNGANPMHSARL